jgi:beta-glucosidase
VCCSGGNAGCTLFPAPITQGSTWNAPLVHAVGAANAAEARATGADRGFGPVLQVTTDPRWGRCVGCAGFGFLISECLPTACKRQVGRKLRRGPAAGGHFGCRRFEGHAGIAS